MSLMDNITQVGVAVFISDLQQRFLFTRKCKIGMAGKWSIPGGDVKPGEMLDEAIHKRVMEEVGVRLLTIGDPSGAIAHTYPNGEHFVVIFYRSGAWLADAGKKIHKDYEIAWLARDDFPAYEDMFPPLDQMARSLIVRCSI